MNGFTSSLGGNVIFIKINWPIRHRKLLEDERKQMLNMISQNCDV